MSTFLLLSIFLNNNQSRDLLHRSVILSQAVIKVYHCSFQSLSRVLWAYTDLFNLFSVYSYIIRFVNRNPLITLFVRIVSRLFHALLSITDEVLEKCLLTCTVFYFIYRYCNTGTVQVGTYSRLKKKKGNEFKSMKNLIFN